MQAEILKVRPRGPYHLIMQHSAPNLTPSGLYIPETAQEKTNRGTVMASGSGYYTANGVHVDNEVEPGDVVIWSKYQGTIVPSLTDSKVVYWLVREDDIAGYERADRTTMDFLPESTL